jgi:hypothetical protein
MENFYSQHEKAKECEEKAAQICYCGGRLEMCAKVEKRIARYHTVVSQCPTMAELEGLGRRVNTFTKAMDYL